LPRIDHDCGDHLAAGNNEFRQNITAAIPDDLRQSLYIFP
jgi:hypothetical protein